LVGYFAALGGFPRLPLTLASGVLANAFYTYFFTKILIAQ